MEAIDQLKGILSDYADPNDVKTIEKIATKYATLGKKFIGPNGEGIKKFINNVIDSDGNYTNRLIKEFASSDKVRKFVTEENMSGLATFLKGIASSDSATKFLEANHIELDKVNSLIDKFVNVDFANKALDELSHGDIKATITKGLNSKEVRTMIGEETADGLKGLVDKITPQTVKETINKFDFGVIKTGAKKLLQNLFPSESAENIESLLKETVSSNEDNIRSFLSQHKDEVGGITKKLASALKEADGNAMKSMGKSIGKSIVKKLGGPGKLAVILGVGAAVMSGNQARRRERQEGLNNTGSKSQPVGPPPLTPIQSSEMYHDETMALAQSISQYHYGAKMPGYMT